MMVWRTLETIVDPQKTGRHLEAAVMLDPNASVFWRERPKVSSECLGLPLRLGTYGPYNFRRRKGRKVPSVMPDPPNNG